MNFMSLCFLMQHQAPQTKTSVRFVVPSDINSQKEQKAFLWDTRCLYVVDSDM